MIGRGLFKKSTGWNIFGKAGISAIQTEATDSRIGEEKQSSVQFSLAFGLKYNFKSKP